MTRKILHIDMDAFFAQVEQRDNPAFRNKPLAVGSANARGVVAAASYEARKFGIYSAMSSSIAQKKCPELIFTPPRFDTYKSVSKAIHTIFNRYTSLIEPLSLDEAYLDVTENFKGERSATIIAKEIQASILQELDLTSSVGISYNKFLAKIASNMNKPFGLTLITPKQAPHFLETLPIEKFYGVGTQTAKKMHQLGIKTGNDLKSKTREELKTHFGKTGDLYYYFARGEDHRTVNPIQEIQSVSAENTFLTDLITQEDIQQEIDELLNTLLSRLQKSNFYGRTFSIKIRHPDFTTLTRSKTFSSYVPHDKVFLVQSFWELYATLPKKPLRLIGITLQSPDEMLSFQTEFTF